MSLSLFDQFSTPVMLGFPLIIIALLVPSFFLLPSSHRWLSNLMILIQTYILAISTKQIFTPINESGHKWALILMTLITYLLTLNLLGLLPYTFTPTTQLSMNMAFAVPLWLATVILGLRNQLSASLAHFLPIGTPSLLIPVMILIESISLIIRPLALGVRLTANLTAGHLLIQLVSMAALALIITSLTTAALITSLLYLLTLLEVAVAMIQAYVFVLLISLYLQENT
uniref:ATP synthase F0 subunit 6 n=1 Tax=Boulenophrys baishanzuensis TaxID=3056955 RepID=UPI0026E489B1|nr:ATP synthase F0 subunit 6 [Boulenophrys baishanzuensis]WJL29545.1 ATP synthase F0 subunit 6 [Boulenophrys baishanzuensis]